MDALGQTKTLVVILTDTDPQPILLETILQVPTTCTSADGILTLDPSGGTPPYTYSLDGGKTYQAISPTITNLQEGFYIFYCKDANGCLAGAITSGYCVFRLFLLFSMPDANERRRINSMLK